MLGAGIRLGEAIATQLPVPGGEAANRLAERLGDMEDRLHVLEVESAVPVVVRAESVTAEEVSAPTGAERLREELRGWLEENVAQRMADVETRLRTESERGQKQLLDAFSEGVQTRVIQRISKLENEVASQSTALTELRECSLRTEGSVQKLLGALDKLIVKNEAPAEKGAGEPAAPAETHRPEDRPANPLPGSLEVEPPARPSRWKIFGY